MVDTAIVDGVLSLLRPTHSFKARRAWSEPPGVNLLDGRAFFHRAYQCPDGKWIAVGASEPHFFALFRRLGELNDPAFDFQREREHWPELGRKLVEIVRGRTRAEWIECFEGTDACVSPVLPSV